MKIKSTALLILVYLSQCSSVLGADYVVGSNWDLADQNLGDGICQTALGPPHNCTLKAAIEEANAHPGSDTITFASKLVFSTALVPLPAITADELIIDGSSQWDTAINNPGIGILAGGGDTGLTIFGSNSVITGITFFGDGTGIHVYGTGNRIGGPGNHEKNVIISGSPSLGSSGVFLDSSSRSTTVQYNFFGTTIGEPWGDADLYRGYIGIRVSGSDIGAGTIIEHNLIGEQASAGIFLDNCGAVKIQNNSIGIYGSGTFLPNRVGIMVLGSYAEILSNDISDNVIGQIYSGPSTAAGAPVITNNRIGSSFSNNSGGNSNLQIRGGIHLGVVSDPPRKTVITGNTIQNTAHDGIFIGGQSGGATAVKIENNLIFDNKKNGIYLSTIGSGSTVAGNSIYSNVENGLVLAYTQDTVVSNNKIGITKFFDEGNGASGISIQNGSTDNLIGGFDPSAANYISFNNNSGIIITGAGTRDNTVVGNIIGSSLKHDISGYLKAGNKHNGIAVLDNAESNDIGITGDVFTLNSPNLILNSGMYGIAVGSSNHNRIFSNMIGTDGDSRNWGNAYAGIVVFGQNNIMKYNTVANSGFDASAPLPGILIWGDTAFNNQISENSIFNNSTSGIQLVLGANSDIQPPLIQRTENTLSGTTYPGSTVEFFSGPDQDEGKFFEGSVVAGGAGNYSWKKTGNFKSAFVTATTTLPVNFSTSAFSLPVQGYIFPWSLFLPAIQQNK